MQKLLQIPQPFSYVLFTLNLLTGGLVGHLDRVKGLGLEKNQLYYIGIGKLLPCSPGSPFISLQLTLKKLKWGGRGEAMAMGWGSIEVVR